MPTTHQSRKAGSFRMTPEEYAKVYAEKSLDQKEREDAKEKFAADARAKMKEEEKTFISVKAPELLPGDRIMVKGTEWTSQHGGMHIEVWEVSEIVGSVFLSPTNKKYVVVVTNNNMSEGDWGDVYRATTKFLVRRAKKRGSAS